MFGYHQATRQKKRTERERTSFHREQNQFGKEAQEREKIQEEIRNKKVSEKAAESKSNRKASREEGRTDLESFLGKNIQGLNPEKRKALQYEANNAINRNYQSENRKMLGEQSQKGIPGKSGVAFAQRMDLQRLAREAEGQANRDLTKLDADMELKNKAIIFAGGEGNAALDQLDKQAAEDELNYLEEKKRQHAYENKFSQQWNRA